MLEYLKAFFLLSGITDARRGPTTLKFYLSQNVLLRLTIVQTGGQFYLYTVFDNIAEKIALGELDHKHTYTYLLIYSLSHELLTPINNMKSSIETLLQQLPKKDPKLKDCVDECRMLNCMNDGLNYFVLNILSYARYINRTLQFNLREVQVADLVAEVSRLFEIKTRRKKVRLEISCPKLSMHTDAEKLAGLLFIFLDNAVKYTHKGSIQLRVKAPPNSEYLRFEVIDTGVGIDEEDLKILTGIMENPFTDMRTTSSAGIGIGFRVAQVLIMYLSAGDVNIDVVSKKGQGTTVMFEVLKEAKLVDNSQMQKTLKKKLTRPPEQQEEYRKSFEVERMLLKVAKYLKLLFDKQISPYHVDPELRTPISLEYSNRSHLPSPAFQTKKRRTVTTSIYLKAIVNKPLIRLSQLGHQASGGSQKSGWNLKSSDRQEDEARSVSVAEPNQKVALVVDDEILNTEYLKDVLETYDLKVYTAYDGENAVELCMKFLAYGRKIDIIFMDYSMPSMNGDVCTAQLRSSKFDSILRTTPIVGFTAHNDESVAAKCLEAGMSMIEFKPISVAKIKAILDIYKIIKPFDDLDIHDFDHTGIMKKVSLDF